MVVKKKREIFVVLLALVFMFASVACGGGGGNSGSSNSGGDGGGPSTASAFSIYDQVNEALSDVKSFAANTNMVMTMFMDGEATDMEMTGLIKMVTLSDTDVEMQIDVKTVLEGVDVDVNSFYKDGMYYVDTPDGKFYMELPLVKMMEQASAAQTLSFSEEAVMNQKVVDKNGGKELSFTLDGEALMDEMFAQLGDLASTLGLDENDMSFGDVEYVVFIDGQNNLKTTKTSFDMEMSMMGETMTISSVTNLEFVQINDVTIDFPDDLDAYVLVDNTMF